MVNRRRSESVSPAGRARRSPASSPESDDRREINIGVTRRSVGGTSRLSASANSRASGSTQRSARARRSTPVARPRRRGVSVEAGSDDQAPSDDQLSFTDEEAREPVSGNRQRRIVAERRNGRGDRRQVTLNASVGGPNNDDTCWYDRMMPEFLLTMTAPLTGYEARLDSDIEEDEYEILERERIKRNKRIRRRLFALMLLAAAAGTFIYTRGRGVRRVGVTAAVSSMAHRIEDGIAKKIHDTMGK